MNTLCGINYVPRGGAPPPWSRDYVFTPSPYPTDSSGVTPPNPPCSLMSSIMQQRRKETVLQYKKNSARLTIKQKYSQMVRGHGPYGKQVWATQSDVYTNPNSEGKYQIGNILYCSMQEFLDKHSAAAMMFQIRTDGVNTPSPNFNGIVMTISAEFFFVNDGWKSSHTGIAVTAKSGSSQWGAAPMIIKKGKFPITFFDAAGIETPIVIENNWSNLPYPNDGSSFVPLFSGVLVTTVDPGPDRIVPLSSDNTPCWYMDNYGTHTADFYCHNIDGESHPTYVNGTLMSDSSTRVNIDFWIGMVPGILARIDVTTLVCSDILYQINWNGFNNCTALTSLTMNFTGVINIQVSFVGCTSLATIILYCSEIDNTVGTPTENLATFSTISSTGNFHAYNLHVFTYAKDNLGLPPLWAFISL